MKNKKSILTFLLALTILGGSFVACSPANVNDGIDTTKTQLNIGMWPGAYEEGMSLETAKRFEEKYADVSFEKGKKGVQVVFNPSANYKASVMTGNFQNYSEDIYFLEESTYYDNIRGGNGDFLEVTDVVNSSFQYDFVSKTTDTSLEDKLFKDKLYDADLQWMNVGTNASPKYYAVPYRQDYSGIWYDVDLFNQRNWYFATNDADSPFITSKTQQKSAGVDNILDTYDDGLPATYEQFFTLCKRIRQAGISPLIWTGQYVADYGDDYLKALYCDYTGLDNMLTTLKFEGNIDLITGFNGDEPIVEKNAVITSENAWKSHEQNAGKYYAIKFAEELINTTVSGKHLYLENSNLSHYQAQQQFMANKYDSNDDCAMILENTWWFTEATANREALKKRYHLEDSDFNYALMPMPKVSADKIGEKSTVMTGTTLLVISRYIAPEKKDLAKAFVQFLATEQSLQEFFNRFNVMLKYKYDFDTESDFYKNANTFGKSALDASKNMNFFTPLYSSEAYRTMSSALEPRVFAFGGVNIFSTLLSSGNTKTAKNLFEQMNFKSIFGIK